MEPIRLTSPSVKRRSAKGRDPIAAFSIREALRRADLILESPCQGHLPRVAGRGSLVHRFVLPLALMPTTNNRFGQKAWALAAMKDRVFRMMHLQHPRIRPEPLQGRPLVRLVRFSTTEPDAFADWAKMAVDCLCVPRQPKRPGGRRKLGLGFLQDDAPRFVEIASWWERAKQGEGLVLIEVWTGETP